MPRSSYSYSSRTRNITIYAKKQNTLRRKKSSFHLLFTGGVTVRYERRKNRRQPETAARVEKEEQNDELTKTLSEIAQNPQLSPFSCSSLPEFRAHPLERRLAGKSGPVVCFTCGSTFPVTDKWGKLLFRHLLGNKEHPLSLLTAMLDPPVQHGDMQKILNGRDIRVVYVTSTYNNHVKLSEVCMGLRIVFLYDKGHCDCRRNMTCSRNSIPIVTQNVVHDRTEYLYTHILALSSTGIWQ